MWAGSSPAALAVLAAVSIIVGILFVVFRAVIARILWHEGMVMRMVRLVTLEVIVSLFGSGVARAFGRTEPSHS